MQFIIIIIIIIIDNKNSPVAFVSFQKVMPWLLPSCEVLHFISLT